MKSILNSSSVLFFFFLFIFVSCSSLLSHRVVAFGLNSEGEALLSLLHTFSSHSIPDSMKLSWNFAGSNTPCNWTGIGCDTKITHVVSLNLSNFGISGQLGPQIGRLRHLKTIDLHGNSLSGPIPIEICNCSHLQKLDLGFNSFSSLPETLNKLLRLNYIDITFNLMRGRIPKSLFQNSGLKYVALSFNHFSGPIPKELWNCTHIEHLGLALNDFIGELPEAVGNWRRLNYLEISYNQLSGRIPESLFQISGLERVSLNENNFSGSIPINIGNATNLRAFSAYNNQLHGTIPPSIANCTQLEVLFLRQNSLSGEIPSGVWRIPTLNRFLVDQNNLSGELPVEVTEQNQLGEINFKSNRFSGMIPQSFGINFTALIYVDFSNNSFSGEIPPSLCFAKLLRFLSLAQNQFHGSIPHFGRTHQGDPQQEINTLDFHGNSIHGEIPSWICNLPLLRDLDLSENQMNGTLPHCLGYIKLKTLKLRGNNFSGTIPPVFSSHGLYMLDLNGNSLEGKIPMIKSPSMCYIDLGNNQLNDTFPVFLETLPELGILVLRSNKLYGPLPRVAFNKLKVLDISSNCFTGDLSLKFMLGLKAMKHIIDNGTLEVFNNYAGYRSDFPKEYIDDTEIYYPPILTTIIYKGKEMRLNNTLITTFRALDLSNNRFKGLIPKSIGELWLLKMINLSNNNFNGHLPSSLGNLTQLESLDLSKNELSGEIPGEFSKMHSLSILNLSHNQFTGRIPDVGQFPTFPNDSFSGNPGLCGLQLSRKCGNSAYRDPNPTKEENQVSDSSWKFGWEPVAIWYGCGVVIGLVIGLVLQYYVITRAQLYRWFRI